MNLTHEHAAESRYAEAVFDELRALLRAPGGGGGVIVLEIHRAPGPLNSIFAIGLAVEAGGRRYADECAWTDWKELPDRNPTAMARALADDVQEHLSAQPVDPEPDGSRRWWSRRR